MQDTAPDTHDQDPPARSAVGWALHWAWRRDVIAWLISTIIAFTGVLMQMKDHQRSTTICVRVVATQAAPRMLTCPPVQPDGPVVQGSAVQGVTGAQGATLPPLETLPTLTATPSAVAREGRREALGGR